MTLLSVSQDSKTLKNLKKGYLTGILYMAPNTIGGPNVCPMASRGCIEACLYTAGRAKVFNTIQKARIKRKQLFFEDRALFTHMLAKEIHALKRKADTMNLSPTVRLNGTSDLYPSEYRDLMYEFSDIPFYDYTKVHTRFARNLPPNYSLTFSRSESNGDVCVDLLHQGHNVAVVFDKLPTYWHDFVVINGDEYDARFLDPKGVIVGLTAKGDAKTDCSGFVVRNRF
jgi:hypothetical protein